MRPYPASKMAIVRRIRYYLWRLKKKKANLEKNPLACITQVTYISSDSTAYNCTSGDLWECKGSKNPNIVRSIRILGRIFQAWRFGPPTYQCTCCNATVWYEERNNKTIGSKDPRFPICCLDGKVQMLLYNDPSEFLQRLLGYKDDPIAAKFKAQFRAYNSILKWTQQKSKMLPPTMPNLQYFYDQIYYRWRN